MSNTFPNSTPLNVSVERGALVNVIVLPLTVYAVFGYWTTPEMLMIKDCSVSIEIFCEPDCNVKLVKEPLNDPEISSMS